MRTFTDVHKIIPISDKTYAFKFLCISIEYGLQSKSGPFKFKEACASRCQRGVTL